MGSALDPEIEYCGQNERAPGKQVQRQLHCSVFFSCATPYGDQRVHREQRDVIPDKHPEKIHRHEHAVYTGDQQEYEREKFLYPVLELPHCPDSGKQDDGGKQQHGKVYPVYAVEPVYPEALHPQDPLDELQSALLVIVCKVEPDAEDQSDRRARKTDLLYQPGSFRRNKEYRHQSQNRCHKDCGKDRKICHFHRGHFLPLLRIALLRVKVSRKPLNLKPGNREVPLQPPTALSADCTGAFRTAGN